MRPSQPPAASSCAGALFFMGRDSHGNWVVQDRDRLRGGLFVDRNQALKFALFENGRRPQAVVMVPGVFELDMSRKSLPADHPADALLTRRAA